MIGLFGTIGLGFGTPAPPAPPSGDITPTGYMGKVMDNLKTLLASSTTFQDDVGAEGSASEKLAQAKLRIHLTDYQPADGNFVRTFAVIEKNENDSSESRAVGYFNQSGSLDVEFERDIPAAYLDDNENATADFLNFLDGVMSDCQTLSHEAGYLMMRSWDIVEGPGRYTPTRNEKDIIMIRITVHWGLE